MLTILCLITCLMCLNSILGFKFMQTSRTFDVEIQVTSQSGDGTMKTLELSMIDHSAYESEQRVIRATCGHV
jgi:hypothetical protein